MEKESKMTHEIQSLDSEMQQLVYENYNKFISATDTIRAMQGKMGHMEAQIQQLETNIKGISEVRCSQMVPARP
jgi:peptidoglycan hydrolase CwlO-like protein